MGHAGLGERKAWVEAKLPSSRNPQKFSALPGAFWDSTEAASLAFPIAAEKRHSQPCTTEPFLLLQKLLVSIQPKTPPNQQHQGTVLMNFPCISSARLWAHSFGTFGGKGNVLRCLTQQNLPSHQLSWIQQFLLKHREGLTHSSSRKYLTEYFLYRYILDTNEACLTHSVWVITGQQPQQHAHNYFIIYSLSTQMHFLKWLLGRSSVQILI